MNIDAPAKINLYLHVTGKRPDGYHTLQSLMCCIDWYDRIHFDFDAAEISVSCSHPAVPEDRKNIAWQAAEAFFSALRHNGGVHIAIEKQIPVGAGMGGGSSDAATVLTALNAHYNTPFTLEQLMRIGLPIGADVPFFIFGKPALAAGIGEKLMPCPLVRLYTVLVLYPGIHVSTGVVFKAFDFHLTKHKKINTKHNSFENAGNLGALLENDLEKAAFGMYPEIQKIKETILEAGAQGALMSGSGSAVFGIFNTHEDACAAESRIRQTAIWGEGWLLRLAKMLQ